MADSLSQAVDYFGQKLDLFTSVSELHETLKSICDQQKIESEHKIFIEVQKEMCHDMYKFHKV